MSADLTVPPPMPPALGRGAAEKYAIGQIRDRDAIWQERIASLQAQRDALAEALQRALDLTHGKGFGRHASDETIARRWMQWSTQAEAALAKLIAWDGKGC